MLKIIMEFRKGVLFVRLKGDLIKNTTLRFERNVTSKIKKSRISRIVFNIQELKSIDIKGINCLFYIYELAYKEGGQVFICNENEETLKIFKKMKVLKYIQHINSELDVFDLVKI